MGWLADVGEDDMTAEEIEKINLLRAEMEREFALGTGGTPAWYVLDIFIKRLVDRS